MNWQSITAETATLLQDLIRFNTTNPPGNETPCVEYIARLLKRDGIESQVFESAPGRGNLVARLKGDGSLPPLLLMGHVDVVPAEADQWQRAPFSGDLVDGVVWGRGATDMKQMVAMELMVFLLAHRERLPLKRDVILMVNADEETGGKMGAAWMVENHPDLIRAEYAINEGGPTSIVLDGKVFYVCSTAEKGSARFTLRTRGAPGHASLPHKDNSILPLARALTKLIETPLPIHVTKSARAHIEALANGVDGDVRKNLLALFDPAKHDQAVAALPVPDVQKRRLSANLRNTATPTILKAGSKINVIPGEAEAQVDCRVLPGVTLESLEPELRAIIGNDIEIEFAPFSPAIESDPDSPLFETIARVIAEHERGATLIPGLITGGTDAKSVTKLGTKVLGFVPMRYEGPTMTGLAHKELIMDLNSLDKQLIADAWTSRELYANLEALCDFGSRFAGSPSEARARDFIREKFHEYGLERISLDPFEYLGWWRGTCTLQIVSPTQRAIDAISLVYSPATPAEGITASVIDVGMGTEKEYAAKRDQLAGKIVLCSSANPEEGRAPHRREKYGWAVDAGAVGFIYARHLPGGLPETGSLRAGRLGEIPAVAISYENGFALRRMIGKGETLATLTVQNQSRPTVAYHVVGEVPGQTDEVVVVGAHYDGHDISQGANDDATGVCLTLELARLFAPFKGQLRRTLRFIAFACEELGVLGSTEYVKAHRAEMKQIAFMMNLDSGVGDGPKGFTFTGLADVETFLKGVAKETRYALRLREKIETASDHFPFFMEGVPAVMMLAKPSDRALGRGFGHTPMDTLDKVNERDMHECAMVAARVLLRVAQSETLPRHRTPDEIKQILMAQDLENALRAQGKWKFE